MKSPDTMIRQAMVPSGTVVRVVDEFFSFPFTVLWHPERHSLVRSHDADAAGWHPELTVLLPADALGVPVGDDDGVSYTYRSYTHDCSHRDASAFALTRREPCRRWPPSPP